ncbi:MAG: TolC family protein, partial [Chitinophagales bacterium]
LLQIVTVRFNNQFVDELDLNRSKAAQILASNQFRQATLLVEKSLNTLKLLAAIPVSQPLEIRDEIAYSSNAPAFGNIQNRPSFIKAQLQNEVSELAVTREKLRFVPELSVYGNYGYNAQRNDLHFKSDQFYRNSTIGVRLDVPIFNGAIRYFNTQKAKLNRQMASLQMQQTQNELAKNDKDLLLDFAKAKEDVTGFRRQLEIAERNYALALVKYRNQAINYDNLVNVNNELLNAQQQLLQGEANYVTVQFQINLTASY